MIDRAARVLTSRRKLLTRGAAASGLALATAGLGPTAVHVQAQDASNSRLKKVLDAGKVIVGTGSANPPWHFEDESGALVGMDIEMAKLLAKGLFDVKEESEYANRIEYVIQAADARIPNLQGDRVDITIQFMTVTAGRAQLAEFTIPYYREAIAMLFLAGSAYNSVAEMVGKGARVSILQNVFAADLVHQVVPDAQVEEFDSPANVLLALDSGRVDAAAIDLSQANYKTALDPGKYKASADSWAPNTYAAAVKPGDQIWLNYVNTVFHEAMTGLEFAAYSAAFKKYFNTDVPTPRAGFPIEFS